MSADRVKLTSQSYELDDWGEWLELAYERHWTDGLPIVPPTPERVRAIVDYLGRDPQGSLGLIPPKLGNATIGKLAINCAMTGCQPEYVPVVLAAVEAMLEPRFNLNGVQCTTHPCEPCEEMLGHPGRYSFCVPEDGQRSPWGPIHAEYGLPADASAVTVFACEAPHSTGVPTVTFVTEPFVKAARAQAAAQGMPELPLVVVPHEFTWEPKEQIERKVDAVFGSVVKQLSQPSALSPQPSALSPQPTR